MNCGFCQDGAFDGWPLCSQTAELFDAMVEKDMNAMSGLIRRAVMTECFRHMEGKISSEFFDEFLLIFRDSPECLREVHPDTKRTIFHYCFESYRGANFLLELAAIPELDHSIFSMLDIMDQPPLYAAIRSQSEELVECYIQQSEKAGGATITNVDSKARTPFHIVAKYGSKQMLTCMLKRVRHGPELIDIINTRGPLLQTAAHIAARRGNIKILWMLWQTGADLHAKDISGRTVLDMALKCEYDNWDVISWLLRVDSSIPCMLDLSNTHSRAKRLFPICVGVDPMPKSENMIASVRHDVWFTWSLLDYLLNAL